MNWKNDTSLTIRSSRKGCSEAIMADYKKSSVHCHSTMCDGKNTLQEMASAACAKGLTTLGFTGHSYTQRDREYCMSPSRTAQYKATIAKLEAEELKGTMHRSEDVAAMTTDLIYAIRGAMMALPGRLAVDVASANSPAEAAEIIRREVNKAMRELSNYRYDPKKYEERVRERRAWEADSGRDADDG